MWRMQSAGDWWEDAALHQVQALGSVTCPAHARARRAGSPRASRSTCGPLLPQVSACKLRMQGVKRVPACRAHGGRAAGVLAAWTCAKRGQHLMRA